MKFKKLLSSSLVAMSLLFMFHSVDVGAASQTRRTQTSQASVSSAQDQPAFGFFYSTKTQTIPAGGSVIFHKNRQLLNLEHTPGTSDIFVRKPGVYSIDWFTVARDQSVFDLRVNGVTVPGTVTPSPGSGFSTVHGSTLVTLLANDVLTVHNASGHPTSWTEHLANNPHNANPESLTARLKAVKIF